MSTRPDLELVALLDRTPSSVQRLAELSGRTEADVQAELETAASEGLVIDWGDVWATTWKAKRRLQPMFFRVWVPLSVSAGAALTALTVVLNAGEPGARWVAPLVLLAGAGALATLLPLARWSGKKGGRSG